MSNQNHLVKGTKPYQYYFFRCIIPKDLRSILGKSQIRISLKNSDYCNSKIVANSLYIVSKNLFDELRLDPMKKITLEDVKEILRIEVRKSLLHIHHYQYGTNVFNKENVLAVDNSTGEPFATLDSGQSPMFVWKPYNISPPRHIEIGISIGH